MSLRGMVARVVPGAGMITGARCLVRARCWCGRGAGVGAVPGVGMITGAQCLVWAQCLVRE